MARAKQADDVAGNLMGELFGDFSLKRATEWLAKKFASFDSSKARELRVDESKSAKDNFKSARVLGYIRTLKAARGDESNRPILVAAIEMRRDITERSSRQVQFNFAKKLIQDAIRGDAAGLEGYPSQGLFFFYDKDQYFRLSLVSGEMDGKKFKFNSAKRQSFYINPERPNNIAKARLAERIETFPDLKDAFSVEALTKEFYAKLYAWYEWAMNPSTGVTFPNDDADDADDRKYNNEAIIRLITRLMFTWFIRQRGLVPDELFTSEGATAWIRDFQATSMEDDDYYRCILQNLFFATLNCQNEKRGFIQHRSGSGYSSGYFIKTKYRYEKEFTDAKGFASLLKKIPFLNCALFDCLDKQEREVDGGRLLLFDGFSDTKKRQAHVPNGLFFDPERGIVQLFDTYEFTIDENNADDADIALDPELLGKVFENLLGAFNPETQETARNATGSFYTPREIVDYMVAESLKNYLKTKVPELKEAWVEDLFDVAKSAQGDALPFDDDIAASVRDALYSCKILDPACGSGAFPMGILHAMVRLFRRLDPRNTDLNDRIIRRYRDEKSLPPDPMESADDRRERLEAIEQQLKDGQHYPDYARKLYLIENCIYGVDIQPIAAQISKLRFFISLLCDQLKDNWNADEENAGLLSLPNLEAKFVCANTLIALPKTEGELALATSGIVSLRQKLQANRHKIFSATTYTRKQALKEKDLALRDQIRDAVRGTLAKPDKALIKIQRELIASYQEERKAYETPKMVRRKKAVQGDLFGGLVQGELDYEDVDLNKPKRDEIDAKIDLAKRKISAEEAKSQPANVTAIDKLANLVAGWDPYDQNATSSFFDPKWMFNIEDGFDIVIGNPPYVQLQANGGELARAYECAGYDTFERTGDLYCLFTERAFSLLDRMGAVSYIMPNKWMLAAYGRKLRRYLAGRRIIYLLNFGDVQFFDTATNYVCVFNIANDTPISNIDVLTLNQSTYNGSFAESVKMNMETVSFDELAEDEWIIRPQKHAKVLSKMSSCGLPLKNFPVEINFGIKTGLDAAYVVDSDVRNRMIAEDRNVSKVLKKILRGRDVDAYVSAWHNKWLIYLHNGVKSLGIPRVEVEKYPVIKKHLDSFGRRLKTRADQGDSSYNLRNCAYIKNFDSPKIIYPNMTTRFPFTYDETGILVNPKCYILTTTRNNDFLKFLVGIFNSKVAKLWIWYFCPELNGGARELQKMCFERIPIPDVGETLQVSVVSAVNAIIAAKKADPAADTSGLEAEIDQLVYKLYDLTPEEIAIVEGRDKPKVEPQTSRPRRTSRPAAVAEKSDDDEELE